MAFEQHYGGLEETRKQFLSQPGADLYPKWYLLKIQSNRVFGSFVYPNAFAGAILLLLPVSLRLTWLLSARLTDITRMVLVGVVSYAGIACLYWSESKGGWLIALGMGALCLSRIAVSRKLKIVVLVGVLLAGTVGFLIKFEAYFKKGATSVSARFGYWQAALDTAEKHPILGSGPGTFSVSYAKIKPPEAEMARLAHNDYLEQASDSGIPGCVLYLAMIGGWLVYCARRTPIKLASAPSLILLGIIGWCAQGFIEFQLYIPGLAWPIFLLFGVALALSAVPQPLKTQTRQL
jgi:O-antigen ligase